MSQAPVQVAEPGLGFQSSPFGILPLGTSIAPDQEFYGATANRAEPPPSALIPAIKPKGQLARDTSGVLPAEARPLVDLNATIASSPRAVIKAARERATAIRRELKRMAALKRELEELERLLSAAKQKPEAKVRALRAG